MTKFLDTLIDVNSAVNNVVWGVPALVLLIGTGVLLTVLSKFFQFRKFGYMWKNTIMSLFTKKEATQTKDKNSISQFAALCTALSATIGTGNIAGIAYAITEGGPGAVFWMWIAAIVGMMTNYAETVLGMYYRRKNANGEWSGGAMYYLRDGVGKMKFGKYIGKILAVLFSIFAIFASFGIGNMSQVASISESITNVAHNVGGVEGNTEVIRIVIGIILMVVVALVLLGGLKRIASFNEKLVPIMAVFYIVGALIIVGINYKNIIPAFNAIFSNAFSFDAVAGGVGGTIIAKAITWGFKRGVFSNEAGLGSSVIAHSTSDTREPVKQGLWGMFGVFLDTIIVCTLTALVVLTTNIVNLDTGAALIEGQTKLALATEAFTKTFGATGGVLIAVAITLFAFSTVLGWSFYGTKAWEFLFGTKSTVVYKVIFVVMVVLCSVLDTSVAIDLSDTFNGLMAIPNLIGVLCLSGLVLKITKNYTDRKIKNIPDVRPMFSAFEDIQAQQEKAEAEENK